jgi:hypothetical protein
LATPLATSIVRKKNGGREKDQLRYDKGGGKEERKLRYDEGGGKEKAKLCYDENKEDRKKKRNAPAEKEKKKHYDHERGKKQRKEASQQNKKQRKEAPAKKQRGKKPTTTTTSSSSSSSRDAGRAACKTSGRKRERSARYSEWICLCVSNHRIVSEEGAEMASACFVSSSSLLQNAPASAALGFVRMGPTALDLQALVPALLASGQIKGAMAVLCRGSPLRHFQGPTNGIHGEDNCRGETKADRDPEPETARAG